MGYAVGLHFNQGEVACVVDIERLAQDRVAGTHTLPTYTTPNHV